MNNKTLCKVIASATAAVSVLSMTAMTAFASGESTGTAQQPGLFDMLLPLIVMLALLYFLMIRPQKKKEKETKQMQDNIEIGDEIVTIGGIVGLVIRKGDDNVVIETGGEKNKMRIKLWAISENTSALERAKATQAEKKAAGTSDAGVETGGLKDEDDDTSKKKKKKKSDEE